MAAGYGLVALRHYGIPPNTRLKQLADACLENREVAIKFAETFPAAHGLLAAVDEALGINQQMDTMYGCSDAASAVRSVARSHAESHRSLVDFLQEAFATGTHVPDTLVPLPGAAPFFPDGVQLALVDTSLEFFLKRYRDGTLATGDTRELLAQHGGILSVSRKQGSFANAVDDIHAWEADNCPAEPVRTVKREDGVKLDQPPAEPVRAEPSEPMKKKKKMMHPDKPKERPPDPKPRVMRTLRCVTGLQLQARTVMGRMQMHIDAANDAELVQLYASASNVMWAMLDPTRERALNATQWLDMYHEALVASEIAIKLTGYVYGKRSSHPSSNPQDIFDAFTSHKAETITGEKGLLTIMENCKRKPGQIPCRRVVCRGIDVLERGLLSCAARFGALVVSMMVAYPEQEDLIDMLLSAVIVVTDGKSANSVRYYIRCETAKGIKYVSCKGTFAVIDYVFHVLGERLGLSPDVLGPKLSAVYIEWMLDLNPVIQAMLAWWTFPTYQLYTDQVRKEDEPEGVFLPRQAPPCRPNDKELRWQKGRGKKKQKVGEEPRHEQVFSPVKPPAPSTVAHMGTSADMDTDQPFRSPQADLQQSNETVGDDMDQPFRLPQTKNAFRIIASDKRDDLDNQSITSCWDVSVVHPNVRGSCANTPVKRPHADDSCPGSAPAKIFRR